VPPTPMTQASAPARRWTPGNQAMQWLLRAGALRPKLAISQRGDGFEHEGDRVAEQVMRMPDPSTPDRAQGPAPDIQRTCSDCEAEMHRQPMEEGKEKHVQRKATDGLVSRPNPAPLVTPAFARGVNQARGGGQGLSAPVRSFMEPRFGRDFADVRVHSDATADELARSVNAEAFTVGRDIFFRAPGLQQSTMDGRKLLAHELMHVVQQSDDRAPEAVQRIAAEDASPPASCDSAPLPPRERWSGNSTLNAIRSEAAGDNRVLVRRGQEGESVRLIQQALVAWGCENQTRNLLPKFGADAEFGAETERAVRDFQNAMGIAQDGLVGPITLSRLDSFVAFGTIPGFPSVNCKVVPPDVPASVIQALASLGFAASSEFASTAEPTAELALSAGIAGVPIFCQVAGAGGGGGNKAPAGICPGTPEHVASIGDATFALCHFTNGSRLTAGAVPRPRPGNEAGFMEMRALGIALFGFVGSSLPVTGPGSAETDWEHGFIQTARSLKHTATYQRGWRSVREVPSVRRDASGRTVPEPWFSDQRIPAFQFQVGKQIITVNGPIGLGPEPLGVDPVGIIDDPLVIFVDTVPINSEPECPCSFLESIEAKGELDTWLVVTPAGKGKVEAELAFLKHVAIEFDLRAEKASGFAVQGTPTMKLENGRSSKAPVLTGPLANDDLKAIRITRGAACPVTIPGVKCPVESPKGPIRP
jgi:Domain of unknown function (DUF4157)/Putative peptidoglycan binding domain